MKNKNPLRDLCGFTLIEIIAVLIILGILAAVAVPRYLYLESAEKERAIDAAVAELNLRESMIWADVKTSGTGYTDDDSVWTYPVNTDLGSDYKWAAPPSQNSQGVLQYKGAAFTVSRTPSTPDKPGVWVRKP